MAGPGEGLAIDDHVLHNGVLPVHAAQGLSRPVDPDVPEHKSSDGRLRKRLQEDAVIPALDGDIFKGAVWLDNIPVQGLPTCFGFAGL